MKIQEFKNKFDDMTGDRHIYIEDDSMYYAYLNDLKESGSINMLGARPYLIQEFDLSKGYASEVLSNWLKQNK